MRERTAPALEGPAARRRRPSACALGAGPAPKAGGRFRQARLAPSAGAQVWVDVPPGAPGPATDSFPMVATEGRNAPVERHKYVELGAMDTVYA